MEAQAAIPMTIFDKFGQLADLLEQAAQLARSLSQKRTAGVGRTLPLLKRPARVPTDEAWFWTEEWQKGEREANEDVRQGRYKTFDTVERLLADLHAAV